MKLDGSVVTQVACVCSHMVVCFGLHSEFTAVQPLFLIFMCLFKMNHKPKPGSLTFRDFAFASEDNSSNNSKQ